MERTSVEKIIDKDFLKLDSEETVSRLFGQMSKTGKQCGVVFSNGDFFGIVSARGVLRKRTDFSTMKVKSVIEKTPVLTRDTSLMKAAELMFVSDSRFLPVVEEGNVFGVVCADSIIREAVERSPLASLKAKELATMGPVVLGEKESIDKAISLMKEKGVNRIIATDGTGKAIGILSMHDIMVKHLIHSTGQRPALSLPLHGHSREKISTLKSPISNEISPLTKTLDPGKKIAPLLEDIGAGYSFVLTEKSKPVGIITRRDLLEAIVKTGAVERNIQVANPPELDEIDAAKVNDTINNSYDRIKRTLGGNCLLVVHFKQHQKEGSRTKHSVHVRASGPNANAKAEHASWNAITSVQEALSELERELREAEEKKKEH